MAQREVYPELPSTQDRAVELARGGAADGSAVVARRQSRGRGRGDRAWASPDGGLYVSVVLRPADRPALLPLAIGAELASSLALDYRVRARLKWPNDLYAVDGAGTGRKLSGVLVDVVPGSPSDAAVAGIGLNVAALPAEVPGELRSRSVALEELAGAPVPLDALESVVVAAAVRARRSLAEEAGAAATIARVRGLLYGVGEPATVDGVPAGTIVGVAADGSLELRGPDGRRSLYGGDVRVGVGR